MRVAAFLCVPALLLALAGCGQNAREDADGADGGGGGAAGGAVEVTLDEQNGSGQTGTATFTQSGQGTNVVVELFSAGPPPEFQEIGIYEGTCADVEGAEPKIEMRDVVQGLAGTTIDTGVDDLTSEPHAIAVWQAEDKESLAACGEIGGG